MKIINLGVLAHVDAGKTTTVEQILFSFGNLRSLGSVDKGSAHTDSLGVERERGISVSNASVSIVMGNLRLNIIDTPGHMDFTGEVERALSVLDGVVLVVSAAEGIQSQTERFWKVLRQMKIPTIIFINKIDRDGCDPGCILANLHKSFETKIISINSIGNIDKLSFTDDGILELCENDVGLANMYLEEGRVSVDDLKASLVKQTLQALAFPLVYGASIQGLGVEVLVDAITTYLPQQEISKGGDLSGVIYKIEHDKVMGKIAHARLFDGAIENRETITVSRYGEAPFLQKITQIRKLSGLKYEDTGQAFGNEIASICGMQDVRAGDILGEIMDRRDIKIATPLFFVKILGEKGQETQLMQAISELYDEDPLLEYTWNHEERELIIRTMGTIQLEIIKYLILERYGMDVKFSAPSVIYKETVANIGVGHESYTMPKPCWAVVTLEVAPLSRGEGYRYQSLTHKSVLQERYQNHVKIAIDEAVKQGRLGWEVTDVEFSLTNGQSHIFHTHPMDFFLATPIAVMRALENASPVLLEPLVKLRMQASEDLAGKLIGDVVKMRGEFDTPVIKNGKLEMEAIVPVATSMDYFVHFSSSTSGKGTIQSDFYGYVDCPVELGQMAKRRGIDPLDRDRWILYKRGAL